MASKPLRVIQAGVGGFGQWWLQVLLKDPLAEVVGAVDVSKKRLDIAVEHGVAKEHCFTSLSDALKSVEADALVDVTSPDAHLPLCRTAAKAGLSILVEKPMSTTLKKAATMAKVADEHGVTLMVSQNYRFGKCARGLRGLVRKKKIGRPEQVSIFYRKAPHFGGFRARMPDPLLVDMSIHHFDLIRSILGTDAVRVWGYSQRPSWSWVAGDASAAVVFEMSDGALVCYDGSWVSRGPTTTWDADWKFEGAKGCLTWSNNKVRLYGPDDEKGAALKLDKPERDGQYATMAEFATAIRRKREPECSGWDNLQSLAMVECAVKACHSGKAVDIEAALAKAIG